MISPKKEIAKLKNESPEYNKAIDDVLELLENIYKKCIILHKKTGLKFNGYDNSFPKGKNTLSKTSEKKYIYFGKTDNEILEIAFNGHLLTKENGIKYVSNKIVYNGSEIHKTLSEHYSDYEYIPLKDFYVKRD